jgi:uncharacterized membrane protein
LALTETIGGIAFYFISQDFIINFVFTITRDELSEDPHDFIAGYFVNLSHNLLLSTQHFISIYLLLHGVIKLGVIIGLLKNKLWAYPVSIFIFSMFIVYQLYRFYFINSLWLLILTFFDMLIIWLVWQEYQKVRAL